MWAGSHFSYGQGNEMYWQYIYIPEKSKTAAGKVIRIFLLTGSFYLEWVSDGWNGIRNKYDWNPSSNRGAK